MLEILRNLQQALRYQFSLVAVSLDPKSSPGFPEHILPAYSEQLGVEYKSSKKHLRHCEREDSGRKNHLLAVLAFCVGVSCIVRRLN